MDKNSANLLILGCILIISGVLLLSYSISTKLEIRNLSAQIDFESIDNNNQIPTSDKYFKYLNYSDYLIQKLKQNKNLPIKNASCIYLDYAQHNAVELYRLTQTKQNELSRKDVAIGNIKSLSQMLENYKSCKNYSLYKKELTEIQDSYQRQYDIYQQERENLKYEPYQDYDSGEFDFTDTQIPIEE